MCCPCVAPQGGTLIIPRSHKPGYDTTAVKGAAAPGNPNTGGAVHAVGPAGSVLVFDARAWHAGAANRSGGRQ